MITLLEIFLFIYLGILSIISIILMIKLFRTREKLSSTNLEKDGYLKRLEFLQFQLSEIHKQNAQKGKLSSTDDLIDSIPEMIIITDKFMRIMHMNKKTEETIGTSRVNACQKLFQDLFKFVNDDNKECVVQFPQNDSFPFLKISIMTNLITKNDKLPVDGYVSRFTSNDIPLFLISLSDDTQSRKLKSENTQQIHQIQENLERVQATAAAGMTLFQFTDSMAINLDNNLKIKAINPKTEQFMGILMREVINTDYKNLIYFQDAQDKDITGQLIEKAANQKETFPEWTFIKHRSTKIPITGYATPDGKGGILIVFKDATQEYENKNSEQMYFSGLIHDLRTPLTTVRGALDLVYDPKINLSDDKKKDIISEAQKAILHMINLVNDLLNVSRIEQNRINIDKTTFDIVSLTNEIIDSQKQTLITKKLFIKHDLTDIAIPKVYADKTKTNEILSNLISNAIKYTQSGGIEIHHVIDNNNVKTLIKDTGAGISESNKSLLFKKFSQIGISRSLTSSRSLGLGLYISKKFADLMNGELKLENSIVGSGSEFSLTLPIAP